MADTGTIASVLISATIGEGWIKAFSQASKNVATFEESSLRAYGNAKKAAQNAEVDLQRFKSRIENTPVSQEQQTVIDKLNIDAFDARLAPTPAPQQIPLGEITAPFASPASPARGNTPRGNVITDNSTQNFTIVQQPGEDAESLAQRIAKIIAGDYASAAAAMI